MVVSKCTTDTTVAPTAELIKEIDRIAKKVGNLSKEDEYRLIEIYKLSGENRLGAEEMYFKQYGSIVKICKQFAADHQRRAYEEDYIQSSFIFMLEALDTFKFFKGTRFNTHLSTILKKCLNDDYYKENGISKYYQQEYHKIGQYKNKYESEHGYKPSDIEIREHFGYTEARYNAILREALALNQFHIEGFQASVNNDTRDTEYLCTEDVLGRNRAFQTISAEEEYEKKELSEALTKVLEDLGPVKAEILIRHAGDDNNKKQSNRRICLEMGLSKSTVNRLLEEALSYAREYLGPYYY